MNYDTNNLENALENLYEDLNGVFLENIIKTLIYYLKNNSISFRNIEKIVSEDVIDLLLFLNEKKILIPQKSSHGTLEWGDISLNPNPFETYRMPQITKLLMQKVQETKVWNLKKVITDKFKQIGDPNYQKMPSLIKQMYRISQNHLINGTQIREICCEQGVEERIDSIISELKGIGIMSPTITRSLFSSVRSKSPQYELNPLLFKLYEQ
ncbi:MAG: hypothetical protein EU541_03805 [Promethearchaeota archaeon]|nr:MAG: hypothetical protein EU541_03805 [Candidatus Lokiarchaeota archaeon]